MTGSLYRVQASNRCKQGLNPLGGTVPLQEVPGVRVAAGAVVDLSKVGPFLTWLSSRWPIPSIPPVVTSSTRTTRGQAEVMLANFKRNRGGRVGDHRGPGARYLLGLYGSDDIIMALLDQPQTAEAWDAVISSFQSSGRYLSQHMRGTAVDLRCWNMTDEDRRRVASVIEEFPGAKVVLESDHIHVEGLSGGSPIPKLAPAGASTTAPGVRVVRDGDYLYRMEPSGSIFIVESPRMSSWSAEQRRDGLLVTDPVALASIRARFAPALAPAPAPASAPAPAPAQAPTVAPAPTATLVQAPAYIPDLSPLPDVLEPSARVISDVVVPYLPDPAVVVPFYTPGPRDAGSPRSAWSKPTTWIALAIGLSAAVSIVSIAGSRR